MNDYLTIQAALMGIGVFAGIWGVTAWVFYRRMRALHIANKQGATLEAAAPAAEPEDKAA